MVLSYEIMVFDLVIYFYCIFSFNAAVTAFKKDLIEHFGLEIMRLALVGFSWN